MKLSSRPTALAAAFLAGALLLVGCSPSADTNGAPKGDSSDSAADVISINYGSWQPGAPAVSNMWTKFLAADAELQAKHGIEFVDTNYTALDALYTDLAQGRVQGVSAAPSSMARQASQGAPVRMASTAARSTAAILSSGKAWTAEDLRGARLVAPTSTGTWADVELAIEDTLGVKPGEYELVSSQDLAGAVTQLAAGTADYAMTWGEYIVNALDSYPNIKVVATPADLAGNGKPFWQFSISLHDSVSDEGAKRLAAAAAEVADWMMENPDEVEALAVEQGQNPGVARSMIADGIQTFDFRPLDDEIRKELTANFDALIAAGKLEAQPPASFFGLKS